jgi:hypothetical protein
MSIKKFFTFLGWPLLLLPTLVLYFGFALNEVCIVSNGGFMPVRQDNCETNLIEKKSDEENIWKELMGGQVPISATNPNEVIDGAHVCMTKNTRFKFLGDIFTTDSGISSLGDQFIEIGQNSKDGAILVWGLLGLYCWHRKKKFYLE